jgi:endogenous inhibitor of DNA gyrase (YacG/DUF329 family)
VPEFAPFCSASCAAIDLSRWLGEKYRIPTAEMPRDMPEEAPPETPAGKTRWKSPKS